MVAAVVVVTKEVRVASLSTRRRVKPLRSMLDLPRQDRLVPTRALTAARLRV